MSVIVATTITPIQAGEADRSTSAAAARSTERRTSQPATTLMPMPSALRTSAREPIRTRARPA